VVGHELVTVGAAARGVVKSLVDDTIASSSPSTPAFTLCYRAALPLSAQTLAHLAGVIGRHRARTGSCWRR
jgi:hypothetical protein